MGERNGAATSAEIAKTISERMARERAARRFSLQDVADRSGLTKSHVWEIEKGRSANPTVDTVVRIARALGVSVDYLTGLSIGRPCLHPEAERIACEIDALIRREPRDD